MSTDLPMYNPFNNLLPSARNEDLVNSVSLIDLNKNYVSPVKSIVRPSFDLLNIIDLSEPCNESQMDIDIIDRSKSVFEKKSIVFIKSSDISQQTFITLGFRWIYLY